MTGAISPALGREVSWTLDQALLWVASRDENIVAWASRTLPVTSRGSWMLYRVSAPSDITMHPDDVEAEMLCALQEGRVTARRDLEVVPAVWFHEATYVRSADETRFVRQDKHPFERIETTDGNALLRYAVERLHPALHASEVRLAFPLHGVAEIAHANQAPSSDKAATSETEEPLKSGAPGRPTSKHLVRGEMLRRLEAESACSSLAQEARELSEWLERSHPKYPPMSPTTIENALRDDYRRHPKRPK